MVLPHRRFASPMIFYHIRHCCLAEVCRISRDKDADSIWENVQPAVMDGKVDSLLFDFPETEAIRNRIFDGNNYSFSVVNRAVTVCYAEIYTDT